jgi:hypothetical protein
MSLIIAALALTWTQPAAPDRPAQWSHITAVSDVPREEVRNLVHLDGMHPQLLPGGHARAGQRTMKSLLAGWWLIPLPVAKLRPATTQG